MAERKIYHKVIRFITITVVSYKRHNNKNDIDIAGGGVGDAADDNDATIYILDS